MMFELLDTTGCYYLYDAVENQVLQAMKLATGLI